MWKRVEDSKVVKNARSANVLGAVDLQFSMHI